MTRTALRLTMKINGTRKWAECSFDDIVTGDLFRAVADGVMSGETWRAWGELTLDPNGDAVIYASPVHVLRKEPL